MKHLAVICTTTSTVKMPVKAISPACSTWFRLLSGFVSSGSAAARNPQLIMMHTRMTRSNHLLVTSASAALRTMLDGGTRKKRSGLYKNWRFHRLRVSLRLPLNRSRRSPRPRKSSRAESSLLSLVGEGSGESGEGPGWYFFAAATLARAARAAADAAATAGMLAARCRGARPLPCQATRSPAQATVPAHAAAPGRPSIRHQAARPAGQPLGCRPPPQAGPGWVQGELLLIFSPGPASRLAGPPGGGRAQRAGRPPRHLHTGVPCRLVPEATSARRPLTQAEAGRVTASP
mmetsp:Transcript_2802/g.9889  ORF Transcript_2802/g.9889 Transcript_2802/m.9889 type:complete len:290 (+) Transcript_2802:1567-2436(+)